MAAQRTPLSSQQLPAYAKYDVRSRDPDPRSSALIVIDVQNYFASMAVPILPALRSSIALCRSSGIPIFFTRHRHRSPADHAMLAEWWSGDLIFDGTPDSELLADLNVLSTDPVIGKTTYSAFYNTDLEDKLRGMGVKEVIIAGVMTNLCCETTAREAFIRGFRVFFSTDATATANKELHEAAITNLAYGFAYLVDCKRLEEGLLRKTS